MKRRTFIQTLTGVVSAVVFTGTGWLMGARTLTMGGSTDCSQFQGCMPIPSGCSFFCAYATNCVVNSGCQQGTTSNCDTDNYYWYSSNQTCPTPYNCFRQVVLGVCNCLPCLN